MTNRGPAAMDSSSDNQGDAGMTITSSAAWTQLLFQVKAQASFGDTVCVVGSDRALGNWDVRRAMPLSTGEACYPTWRSCTVYVSTGKELQYKFLIRHGDGSVDWEGGDMNRRVIPTGGRLLLVHDYNRGLMDMLEVYPLYSAWSDRPPSFARLVVPSEAVGKSWQQSGKFAHVLFRRLRSGGVEYLLEHRSKTMGQWDDGANQLCLPGGHKSPDDPDSRWTAFRRATETCLGGILIEYGWHTLYEAFKFALADMLTVSAAVGGYYVCDFDELMRGLNKNPNLEWNGSVGLRTSTDVDCSVFVHGSAWVPARIIRQIIESRPCSYAQDMSRSCPTCLELSKNEYMKGVPIYGQLKRNLTRFRHKLWI